MKADTKDADAKTGSATINYLDIKGFSKDDKITIKAADVVVKGEKLIAADEYKIIHSTGTAAKGDKDDALTAGAGTPNQTVVKADTKSAANTG